MSTPLLTIKKSDGTYKKMPLDQFKMPEKKIPLNHQSMSPKTVVVQKNKDDFKSPFEEPLPKNTSIAQENAVNPAEEIMASLSFKVDSSLEHRLRSAIQLRLKEVRGEEETKNTLMRDTKQGGLGLVSDRVSEVLQKCANHLLPQVYKKNLPLSIAKPPMNTKNTPSQKPMVSSLGVKTEVAPKSIPQSIPPSPRPQNFSRPADEKVPFNLGVRSLVKPVVTDIVSKPVELGPVEEIEYITLVDFRRLAPNPTEAAARLGQKLINLKEESVMLYLQSIDAWKKSPLYADYTTKLLTALAHKKKLSEVVVDKQGINLLEMTAIVAMEKEVMAL